MIIKLAIFCLLAAIAVLGKETAQSADLVEKKQARRPSCRSEPKKPCYKPESSDCPNMRGVKLNFGELTPVNFNQPGQWANEYFYFYSTLPTAILVTDCYCNGDYFAIYDNGEFLALTNELNCNDEFTGSTCQVYGPTPEVCLTGLFCRNDPESNILEPGYHNITILTIATYFGGGTAYILTEVVPDTCI